MCFCGARISTWKLETIACYCSDGWSSAVYLCVHFSCCDFSPSHDLWRCREKPRTHPIFWYALLHHYTNDSCTLVFITPAVAKASGTTCIANVLTFVLLQAMMADQSLNALLIRSGDVETNPGPGLYPGM